MNKNYYTRTNIGKAKYVVNFHDGAKTHPDGSAFYDIEIFKNKKSLEYFILRLQEAGYQERNTFAFLTPDHPIDETPPPAVGTSPAELEKLNFHLSALGYGPSDKDAILACAQKKPAACARFLTYGRQALDKWLETAWATDPLPNYSHTPGPWANDGQETVFVRTRDGYEVEICNFKNSVYRDGQAANVALVTAAPDLLETLEAVDKILYHYLDETHPLRVKIETALANAKGL